MTTSPITKEIADKIGNDTTTVYSLNDDTWNKIQTSESNLTYLD